MSTCFFACIFDVLCACVGRLCKMCVFLEGIRIDPGKCYYFFSARLAKSGEPLGMGWKSVTSSSTLKHSKKKKSSSAFGMKLPANCVGYFKNLTNRKLVSEIGGKCYRF